MKLYKHPAPAKKVKIGNYWDEDPENAVESGDLDNIVSIDPVPSFELLEELFEIADVELGNEFPQPLRNKIEQLLGLK